MIASKDRPDLGRRIRILFVTSVEEKVIPRRSATRILGVVSDVGIPVIELGIARKFRGYPHHQLRRLCQPQNLIRLKDAKFRREDRCHLRGTFISRVVDVELEGFWQ